MPRVLASSRYASEGRQRLKRNLLIIEQLLQILGLLLLHAKTFHLLITELETKERDSADS